jgi:thymidylate synthase ThyX
MDEHTQAEHREIATDCWNVLTEVLPVATKSFEKYYLNQ